MRSPGKEENKVCLEKQEGIPEEIEVLAEHQTVPNKEATMENIRTPEGQCGDQHLDVESRTVIKTEDGQCCMRSH
jgi:hypothetical protein